MSRNLSASLENLAAMSAGSAVVMACGTVRSRYPAGISALRACCFWLALCLHDCYVTVAWLGCSSYADANAKALGSSGSAKEHKYAQTALSVRLF